MAYSMEAARLAVNRTVCDVCGAHSSRARGTSCRTCTVGTLRYVTELQVLRDQRSEARRADATRGANHTA
jgi:ribosomal protein L40E